MSDPRIPLKNPMLAGVLAWLIPGAGHLYQGRTFKAAVFFFSIMGTFVWGLSLGDWQVVYRGAEGRRNLGYYAQVLIGLPALPALLQAQRFAHPENVRRFTLDRPLESSFEGELIEYGPDPAETPVGLSGTVRLEPVRGALGPEIRGLFRGTTDDGREIELELGRSLELDRPVYAERTRSLRVDVLDDGRTVGRIEGSVPRRFRDWFQVPLDQRTEGQLRSDLGQFFELAVLYTWIAGLLNILAVWDAVEGPAYGYGDDDESTDEKDPDDSASAPPPDDTPPASGEPPRPAS